MNPLQKFKNYIVGNALTKTNDVFEEVKVQVLFRFTLFFLALNIPYSILSFSTSRFHFIVALGSCLSLVLVLAVLKKAKDIKWAIYFYVLNHLIQNFTHFIINNGRLEMQGVLFFLLIVLFGFLMIDRIWGYSLLLIVMTLYFVGFYNVQSGYALFSLPSEYADPVDPTVTPYFTVIPILLNVFLISQFVKAKQKAEQQIKQQKIQLEASKKELEIKNHDVTDSINYAKRIQYAVLPQEETIYRSIPLSFIHYKPKDIVSGDFFWFHEINRDEYVLVCADCTGHGVPGAFMTVIGSSLLNQTVIDNKIYSPSQILLELDRQINFTLKQQKDTSVSVQDGMDITLLKVNKVKKELVITSAKRPVLLIRNNELQEIKASKFSLGGMRSGEKLFTEVLINYQEDDILYMFTDGVVDQFGGEKSKKFSSKRLRELLLEIHKFSMPDQKNKLSKTITNWQGNLEQIDDILVMGIKF